MQQSAELRLGRVERYHPDRAYGFLSEDGGKLFFFHLTQYKTPGPDPVEGDRVEFVAGISEKDGRPCAVEVRRTDKRGKRRARVLVGLAEGVVTKTFTTNDRQFWFVRANEFPSSEIFVHSGSLAPGEQPRVGDIVSLTIYAARGEGKSPVAGNVQVVRSDEWD